MSINIKHPGLLHSKLGVPQGQKIPESKIQQAAHSSSPALRKEAQFAINASHFNHAHNEAPKASPHASAVAAAIKSHKHGA